MRSYPLDEIVDEIILSLKSGCKEIWLTSQDCGSYGRDIGVTLPDLLGKVADIDGKFRVRIGMSNPDQVLPILHELIEKYKSDKIYKFLHIPVQSGSNRVLKVMNRRYTVDEFKYVVTEFRKVFPKINIITEGHNLMQVIVQVVILRFI